MLRKYREVLLQTEPERGLRINHSQKHGLLRLEGALGLI